jgi:sirohydrochlorin cobaltochelatase
MKHLFFLLTLLFANLFSLQAQNKTAALVITHYGSSDAETRTRTLDVITREAQAAFPHLEVREAYISPIVRKRMARQGVHKDSPLEALLKLRAEGFDTVYVQSTTLIEGGEMTSVRHDAASVSQFFRKIEVGNPLLYSTADCRKVISILTDNQPTGQNEAIVYIGHGNQLPSTATYAMLDYMLKADGKNHIHVSTIEGYPDLTATTHQLKESQTRKVTLVPLLLVCGNHTKEDIAGTWKDALEKEGYTVSVLMRGLGELQPIRSIFLEHIADILAD